MNSLDNYKRFYENDKKINIKKFISKFKIDPLDEISNLVQQDRFDFLKDGYGRYHEMYTYFYLSLERFLDELSITLRYNSGLKWRVKYHEILSERDIKLKEQYKKTRKYNELDFEIFIVCVKNLIDRSLIFSRILFKNNNSLSFTSFNDHKKWINKNKSVLEENIISTEYFQLIKSTNIWFDNVVKLVRDKYFMHQGPKNFKFLGISHNNSDLNMIINNLDENVEPRNIIVSVPVLANDLYEYLDSLSKILKKHLTTAST